MLGALNKTRNGGSVKELDLQRDLAGFILDKCGDLIPEKSDLSDETRAMILSGYVLNVASRVSLETYLIAVRERLNAVSGHISNVAPQVPLASISARSFCREGYQLPEITRDRVIAVLNRLR